MKELRYFDRYLTNKMFAKFNDDPMIYRLNLLEIVRYEKNNASCFLFAGQCLFTYLLNEREMSSFPFSQMVCLSRWLYFSICYFLNSHLNEKK